MKHRRPVQTVIRDYLLSADDKDQQPLWAKFKRTLKTGMDLPEVVEGENNDSNR